MSSCVKPIVLTSLLVLTLCACVHKIHISPTPGGTAADPLPFSVTVDVTALELEGADHRPGILLLEWTAQDLRRAVLAYAEQRRTFQAVHTAGGEATLSLKAFLTLRSRDRYHYTVQLDGVLDVGNAKSARTYQARSEAIGSTVRWVTASDRDPINEAAGRALDDLFTQIEADREILRGLANTRPF